RARARSRRPPHPRADRRAPHRGRPVALRARRGSRAGARRAGTPPAHRSRRARRRAGRTAAPRARARRADAAAGSQGSVAQRLRRRARQCRPRLGRPRRRPPQPRRAAPRAASGDRRRAVARRRRRHAARARPRAAGVRPWTVAPYNSRLSSSSSPAAPLRRAATPTPRRCEAHRHCFTRMYPMPARLFALLSFLFLAFLQPAVAQVSPPSIAARSWLLLDATTGQVLAAQEPDTKIEPASLTKIMTVYLAFDALREKRITLEQRPA